MRFLERLDRISSDLQKAAELQKIREREFAEKEEERQKRLAREKEERIELNRKRHELAISYYKRSGLPDITQKMVDLIQGYTIRRISGDIQDDIEQKVSIILEWNKVPFPERRSYIHSGFRAIKKTITGRERVGDIVDSMLIIVDAAGTIAVRGDDKKPPTILSVEEWSKNPDSIEDALETAYDNPKKTFHIKLERGWAHDREYKRYLDKRFRESRHSSGPYPPDGLGGT